MTFGAFATTVIIAVHEMLPLSTQGTLYDDSSHRRDDRHHRSVAPLGTQGQLPREAKDSNFRLRERDSNVCRAVLHVLMIAGFVTFATARGPHLHRDTP